MDFTNNPGPQTVILATGTNDIVGTIGTVGASGQAQKIVCAIKCVSGAVTGFTAQTEKTPVFGFENYLTGTDWVSAANYSQRDWTSTVSPASMTAGQTSYFDIKPDEFPLWQFLASGTPGTVLIVDFKSTFNVTLK